MPETPKPRVLFIRHKRVKNSADFLNNIEDESVRTLSRFLDLQVIDQDFDYAEICDRLNPDFVILDSPGGNRPVPVIATNIDARPDIPRVGYSVQDPHDTARTTFYRLLVDWKVQRFFTTCTAMLVQSPEAADRGFVLPLYIDTAIFKDYGLEKLVPLSIFGAFLVESFYAWRAETAKLSHQYIPTLLYTHPGYDAKIPASRYHISGIAYAQMLNRSYFSLADTTRLDYLVRKHLEIPASGAILIAPDTPEIASYGFMDMHNCILGSREQLMQKIDYVAADPQLYQSICRNGHDLVHGSYGADKWTGFVDWFKCHQSLKPNEMVQQQGIYGPFTAVPKGDLPGVNAALPDNEFTVLMKENRNRLLYQGDAAAVEQGMHRILHWLGHIGEPWVFMGISHLLRGNLGEAKKSFLTSYVIRMARDQFTVFDPEEVAWLLLLGSMVGDRELLGRIQPDLGHLRHISIRRMDFLARALAGQADIREPQVDVMARQPNDHISVNWMGDVAWHDWLGLIDRIFRANGMKGVLPS